MPNKPTEQVTSAAEVAEERLRDFALGACRDEYKDMLDSWRTLDVKAQGLTAIAGIFLGGLFALISKVSVHYSPFLRVLLVCCVLLLLTSFAGALRCLLIKPAKAAPSADIATAFAIGICDVADMGERAERTRIFYQDILERWKATNHSLLDAIQDKGSCIHDAQVALLGAAVILGFVACATILTATGSA